MSNTRLSNDLAILYVDRDINLNHPYVNTACLPSCDNQFDYHFSNGTGVRCYVAGWGKDEFDGSFQFIPKKVICPLSAMLSVRLPSRLPLMLKSLELETGSVYIPVKYVLAVRLEKMLALVMEALPLFVKLSLAGGLWLDLLLGVLDVPQTCLVFTLGCHILKTGLIPINREYLL